MTTCWQCLTKINLRNFQWQPSNGWQGAERTVDEAHANLADARRGAERAVEQARRFAIFAILQFCNKKKRIAKFCNFLVGSFSAVSKRNFATKYAFDSIFQALQDLHTSAPLQTQILITGWHYFVRFQ